MGVEVPTVPALSPLTFGCHWNFLEHFESPSYRLASFPVHMALTTDNEVLFFSNYDCLLKGN